MLSRLMLGCDNEETKAGVTTPGASEGSSTVIILLSFVLCFDRRSHIAQAVSHVLCSRGS